MAMQWEAKQHAKEKCKDKGMWQLGYTFLTHNKQNKSLGGGEKLGARIKPRRKTL
jgi:hypothetical protein